MTLPMTLNKCNWIWHRFWCQWRPERWWRRTDLSSWHTDNCYETNETTDKDNVLVHTHYSKELQVMNCNQFCLCRLRHSVVNYQSKCSILEREKQLFRVYAVIHDGRHVSFVVLWSTMLVKSEIKRWIVRDSWKVCFNSCEPCATFPPPLRPQPFSDHLKIRKKFHNSENCPPPVHPLSYLFTYVFMGTFLNSTILGRKRTGDEVMFDVTRPWTGSGNVQEGC